MNHIELFAGCGGLSLGFKHSGYQLVLANELSPMAAESFAYNFLGENLEAIANNNKRASKALWLNSAFADLKKRLRENPQNYPLLETSTGFSDLPENYKELKGKLLVGSILELNYLLDNQPKLVEQLKSAFGDPRGLDLVSGGPPCQSFSMAGLRQKNDAKNSLPWEFAKFVRHTQPKIALLENVTGILRPFKDEDGNLFHAWYEVAKAFAVIGYIPLCLHINARFAGVAQNRPRFIMIAIRSDYFGSLRHAQCLSEADLKLFLPSFDFYQQVKAKGTELDFGYLNYFDVNKEADRQLLSASFIAEVINQKSVSVKDALDDLKQNYPSQPSDFILQMNQTFNQLVERNHIANHEFRNNGETVQRRFRIYQVLSAINDRAVTKSIFAVLRGESEQISPQAWEYCCQYQFLLADGTLSSFITERDFIAYLKEHPTKKQTQKALIADLPAPAALSIPDDACHYDEHELRVLTVREMARIQSFPDNFVFRSKVTTGGQMRRFEVPQYTQVGNAVPPLLALRLAQSIAKLLESPKLNLDSLLTQITNENRHPELIFEPQGKEQL